jgi:hypothetical protein
MTRVWDAFLSEQDKAHLHGPGRQFFSPVRCNQYSAQKKEDEGAHSIRLKLTSPFIPDIGAS